MTMPERPAPLSVIFDLDGTLVDSAPDLAGAMNAVLAAEGRPAVSPDAVRQMVGHGARALIERGMAATGAPAAAADMPRLVEMFLAHYRAHIADGSRAFTGVEAALDALAAQGCLMGVCTNKPEALAIDLLDRLGLLARFGAVLGADSVPARKPDPGHYRATVARLGGDLARSVMVGDSDTDFRTARAAGVPVILVTFGYTPVPAAELGPDALIESFDALGAALARVLPPS